MKKLWIGIGVVVVLVAVFIVTQTKREPEVVKIGAILPLTGPSSLLGEMAKNGLLLAAKNINEDGGINGKKLELIFEDGQADPKISVFAFRKLISFESVKAVVVTHSNVGLALTPIADKEKIILLVHASHPKITGSSPYVFRHSNVADQESEVIVQFVSKNLSADKVAIAVMDDDYGMVFKKTIENLVSTQFKNTSIVKSIVYEKTESDFKSITQKLLSANPDVIIIAGLGNGVGILIKRLREYGYKREIIITLGATMTGAFQSAGEAAKGIYFVTFDIDEQSKKYKDLNEEYKKLYNSDLSAAPLIFYNSLILISDAMRSAGVKPEDISRFISSLRSFDGVGEKMHILRKYNIVPKLKVLKK